MFPCLVVILPVVYLCVTKCLHATYLCLVHVSQSCRFLGCDSVTAAEMTMTIVIMMMMMMMTMKQLFAAAQIDDYSGCEFVPPLFIPPMNTQRGRCSNINNTIRQILMMIRGCPHITASPPLSEMVSICLTGGMSVSVSVTTLSHYDPLNSIKIHSLT